jgi:hypothetical protein
MPTKSGRMSKLLEGGCGTHIGPPFTEWLGGFHHKGFADEEYEDEDEPRYRGVSKSCI